jgi:hypothetical protein
MRKLKLKRGELCVCARARAHALRVCIPQSSTVVHRDKDRQAKDTRAKSFALPDFAPKEYSLKLPPIAWVKQWLQTRVEGLESGQLTCTVPCLPTHRQ